ncbi:hypothetical protein [Kitasatospora sp. NPDC057015]|uniref:hypothetical protein n=1 Tax=Kitasatospora sp. NPDC057015 TaxID=3346001 RepID=UPI003645A639
MPPRDRLTDRAAVLQAARDLTPETIDTQAVVVAGRLFPVKQIARAVVANPGNSRMVLADLHALGFETFTRTRYNSEGIPLMYDRETKNSTTTGKP